VNATIPLGFGRFLMAVTQTTIPENRWHSAAGAARQRLYGWRRKAATVAVGALALAMGYGVVFGHNGLKRFEQKRVEEQYLQNQMLTLQRENDKLQGHVDRLQNDPGAIEHQAREELHYTRAGEVIYSVPEPAKGQNAAPAANQ
jgi:cell division protein FtsB